MVDLYHKIYDGEIFQKSRCIWHENTLMDFFRSTLTSLGYRSVSDSNKVWERNNQQVVVCLVDDVFTCAKDHSKTLPYLFDRNTVVITDNQINVPTQYKVHQLPTSFYGIYNHEPSSMKWDPNRRFNFSVNRLDTKRLLLMLELWHRCMLNPDLETLDYINFNCWSWSGDNASDTGLKDNFKREWSYVRRDYESVYQPAMNSLTPRMPLRNHALTHEQSHVSAWVNVVAETYSSDTTVALSEKTFRALCLPVPWILYSGKNTVAYLHSLGFDVMHDIIEHKYDNMIENKTAAYGDKMVDFIFEGADSIAKMKKQDFATLKDRCVRAAEHNQKLLLSLAQQWPVDFAHWWPQVVQSIA